MPRLSGRCAAHAAELERCARAGVLAVGIDAAGHGARRDPAIADRLAEAGGALPVMLAQVEQTVGELPALIDALATEFGADRSAVSMVGISMGAFLAYRAIAGALPLRAVVALLGSPEWPGETSAHRTPEGFRDAALLSITAEHDVSGRRRRWCGCMRRWMPGSAPRRRAGMTGWPGLGISRPRPNGGGRWRRRWTG